jgi:hypothetical protein
VISTIFKAMDTPTRHEGKLDDRYRKAAGTPRWADVFPRQRAALLGQHRRARASAALPGLT